MIVVIIEYELNDGVHADFMSMLGTLLPAVAQIDGFIRQEPARSMEDGARLFEVSYWRDRAAVAAWARHPDHVEAKRLGRERFLKWYRIVISEVTADWGVGGPAPKVHDAPPG